MRFLFPSHKTEMVTPENALPGRADYDDPLGKIEAVVGVDYDAHAWLDAIADARGDRINELAFILATITAAMIGLGRMQTDMARRRHAETEHRRADERWHRIFEQLPLAYAEWDPNGMVIEWSPAAERIFGWRREEVLGRSNLEVIVAPSARQHVAGIWRERLGYRDASGLRTGKQDLPEIPVSRRGERHSAD